MTKFKTVKEKDAYAFVLIEEMVQTGLTKSAAVQRVQEDIGDVSPATTWSRYRREAARRKEVSRDGQ